MYCGLKSDGSIACWDRASTVVDGMSIPGEVIPIPGPTGSYTELSAGLFYTCAQKNDDSFTCWNLINPFYDPVFVPVPIPSGPYTQLGNDCALKSNGQIVCWDVYSNASSPYNYGAYNYTATASAPPGPYTQVGNDCGLRSDGMITCWSRQAESGSLVERSTPTGSYTKLGGNTSECDYNYTQLGGIRSECNFNCAITSSGTINCWDWADTTNASVNDGLRLRVAPSGSYTQISGTGALKDDGTITCWEWDSDFAGIINPHSFSLVPTPSGSYTQATNIHGLGCAIKSDGSLACWGSDVYNLTTVPSGSFTQVSTANIPLSSAGDYIACALETDGSIVCWNGDGQAEAPSGYFIQVLARRSTRCAIRRDNSIVCWGDNSAFFPATL